MSDAKLSRVHDSTASRTTPALQGLSARAPSALRTHVICLSHLRWNFVFQRPQHLLTRCARTSKVYFFEEPLFADGETPHLERVVDPSGVLVLTPKLPTGLQEAECEALQRRLLDAFLRDNAISSFHLWYYSPMARGFTRHLKPEFVIYDCMDELSAFKFAPPRLKEREAELFRVADLVFTGGQSLFEAKRNLHPRVFAFPSSVDIAHFSQARTTAEAEDQSHIAGPKIGFFGVVDERMDLELLDAVATLRPDWNLIVVGPVVKIDPASLPRHPNLHFLGGRPYAELPRYLAGWDVAMMPFALNESTRFISPTKTPEYLAAGRPVVSTAIRDVVRPYGEQRLVDIVNNAEEFVEATEKLLRGERPRAGWESHVELFLSRLSWDRTWMSMSKLISGYASTKHRASETLPSHQRSAVARSAGASTMRS